MTVATRMQAVRRFFEHLEKTDVILVNPCAGIPLPRLGDRLPKAVLTEKEARALLDAPDTQTAAGHPGQGHPGNVLQHRHTA